MKQPADHSDAVREAEAARGRAAFLAEAGALLSASLDYETTLASVARMAVQRVADWCSVEVLGQGESIRQLAVAHVDESKVELAKELRKRYPRSDSDEQGVSKVLRTRRAELWPVIGDTLLAATAKDAEHLRILRELGLKSAMIVPMVARDRVVGAITFVSAESGKLFTPEDLVFAEDLARRAASAVDNALLYREARDAERRLSRQLEFTRALNASLGEGLYAVDRTGLVTYVNPVAERMLGHAASELIGRNIHDVIHFQHADGSPHPKELCPLLDVTRRGETYQSDDDVFTRRDGTMFPVAYTSSPILEGGMAFGAVVSFRDVTEQRRAAEVVRASEARFRFLAESVPAQIWTATPEGALDYVNERVLAYFGRSREHVIGRGWRDVVHPDDLPRCAERWERSLATGEPYEVDFRLRRFDGEYRWHIGRAAAQRDEAGAITKWFGTNNDVTERREAEEILRRSHEELERRVEERTAALREANVRLQQSNRELQDFASVASHDLQEPLRKIQAFGDRLAAKAGPSLGEEGRDYLGRMKNAAGRMQLLINDLLAFSRVTTQAQPFVPVDLDRVAREVLSDLEIRIAEAGGTVELSPLPTIDADPTQMRQLMQNLVANALKFRRPGVASVVRVSAELDSDRFGWLTLLVEDNGIGFDEKYLDRIFSVFQRLHGRNEYEGTGIGLAVCRKIAERHGGSVSARSTPGVGSRFVVSLPVRQKQVLKSGVGENPPERIE